MSKTMLRAISIGVFLIGSLAIICGVSLWTRSIIYNPDLVVTVHNDTTDRNTQAYGIGNMRVYIDQTFRMDMPIWQTYVKAQGAFNNPQFDEIKPGAAELVLNRNNNDIDENPFIMKLKIMNVSDKPISINADRFMIRTLNNEVIKPNHAWQEVLAKAKMFSGALDQKEIQPNEEKVLWLVYGTKTSPQKAGAVYQEFVRINYDSDSDMLATKVEFPFNYTDDTRVGNTTAVSDSMYNIGFIGILIWLGICGAGYYLIGRRIEE